MHLQPGAVPRIPSFLVSAVLKGIADEFERQLRAPRMDGRQGVTAGSKAFKTASLRGLRCSEEAVAVSAHMLTPDDS